MPTTDPVKTMTDKALAGLIKRAQAEQERRKKAREEEEERARGLAEARKKVEKFAAGLGYSLDDFIPKDASSKKKVTAKYQNPEDRTQTWSGRGPKPGWVQEYWEEHGNIDGLLIIKK